MLALLSPRMLIVHLVAVVGIVAASWLGWWQVDAWQDHRHDKVDALKNADPMPLDEALGPDDVFMSKVLGQPVTLEGTWLGDQTRTVHGWLVTPVATATGSAILVVRGAGEAPDPTGPVQLTGWLQPSGAADVRTLDFLQQLDQDLYGGYVIARDPVEAALTPVTPDQLPEPSAFTSLRNLLYGIEWWVFGGFAVFLWVRWCRDEVRSRAEEQSGTAPRVAA